MVFRGLMIVMCVVSSCCVFEVSSFEAFEVSISLELLRFQVFVFFDVSHVCIFEV